MSLMGCASSIKHSLVNDVGPDALVVASCPKLTGLEANDFGATTLKLIEVATQYRMCRAAALAEAKPK